jgi:hypothetical protein
MLRAAAHAVSSRMRRCIAIMAQLRFSAQSTLKNTNVANIREFVLLLRQEYNNQHLTKCV